MGVIIPTEQQVRERINMRIEHAYRRIDYAAATWKANTHNVYSIICALEVAGIHTDLGMVDFGNVVTIYAECPTKFDYRKALEVVNICAKQHEFVYYTTHYEQEGKTVLRGKWDETKVLDEHKYDADIAVIFRGVDNEY